MWEIMMCHYDWFDTSGLSPLPPEDFEERFGSSHLQSEAFPPEDFEEFLARSDRELLEMERDEVRAESQFSRRAFKGFRWVSPYDPEYNGEW
jgi:hypothetical protein